MQRGNGKGAVVQLIVTERGEVKGKTGPKVEWRKGGVETEILFFS